MTSNWSSPTKYHRHPRPSTTIIPSPNSAVIPDPDRGSTGLRLQASPRSAKTKVLAYAGYPIKSSMAVVLWIRRIIKHDLRTSIHPASGMANDAEWLPISNHHCYIACDPNAFLSSGLRKGNAGLTLIFTTAIFIADFANFIRLKKQHLRHAFVGIDLRRQGCGI